MIPIWDLHVELELMLHSHNVGRMGRRRKTHLSPTWECPCIIPRSLVQGPFRPHKQPKWASFVVLCIRSSLSAYSSCKMIWFDCISVNIGLYFDVTTSCGAFAANSLLICQFFSPSGMSLVSKDPDISDSEITNRRLTSNSFGCS